MKYALSGNKIVYINNTKANEIYKCLVCNRDVRVQIVNEEIIFNHSIDEKDCYNDEDNISNHSNDEDDDSIKESSKNIKNYLVEAFLRWMANNLDKWKHESYCFCSSKVSSDQYLNFQPSYNTKFSRNNIGEICSDLILISDKKIVSVNVSEYNNNYSNYNNILQEDVYLEKKFSGIYLEYKYMIENIKSGSDNLIIYDDYHWDCEKCEKYPSGKKIIQLNNTEYRYENDEIRNLIDEIIALYKNIPDFSDITKAEAINSLKYKKQHLENCLEEIRFFKLRVIENNIYRIYNLEDLSRNEILKFKDLKVEKFKNLRVEYFGFLAPYNSHKKRFYTNEELIDPFFKYYIKNDMNAFYTKEYNKYKRILSTDIYSKHIHEADFSKTLEKAREYIMLKRMCVKCGYNHNNNWPNYSKDNCICCPSRY